MSGRRSAGLLLFRGLRPGADRVDGIEVLLAHPGGPLFANRDDGAWTIPKGAPDGEDDLLGVAIREFEEETGHRIADVVRDPTAAPIPLQSVVQRSGKVVHAWAIEGDLDPAAARSNRFEMEWPPRSGRRIEVPEIDRVAWFAPSAARRKMNPAQVAFIDRLLAALAGDASRRDTRSPEASSLDRPA